MAERSSISQSVQIGVESTPGTPVAAGKRLASIGFAIAPKVEATTVRPIGQKYPTLEVVGKEWSEAEIEGSPVYTELPYIFASLFSTPTITQYLDGATPTGAYRYVFDTAVFGDDAPKTYTLEQGSAFRAHRVANAIFTEWSMEWSREEIEIGGMVLAKALEDGVTLTATPTALPTVPVRPSQMSVYLDDTAAALGTTKLTRALKGSVEISDRFGPLWVVDAAEQSFVTTVEIEPTVEFTLMQMADATAMGNLTAMRAGQSKFLRLEAVGPRIYDGPTDYFHKFTLDLAGQVKDISEFSDEDGVYAIEWTFGNVYDTTWGKSMHCEVVTSTASL